MNQGSDCVVKFSLQELSTIDRGGPGLPDECFSQWVVAINQVIVPAIETRDQRQGWHARHFASQATVAVTTGQHQIPYPIGVHQYAIAFQHPGKKVINIRQSVVS